MFVRALCGDTKSNLVQNIQVNKCSMLDDFRQ